MCILKVEYQFFAKVLKFIKKESKSVMLIVMHYILHFSRPVWSACSLVAKLYALASQVVGSIPTRDEYFYELQVIDLGVCL